MTANTPGISILFDKWHARIEGIATLSTEKVPDVPLSTASDNDFAFDRRLAGLATRAEQLVKIEMTIETQGRICVLTVCIFQTSTSLFVRLGIECDQLQIRVALVAHETSGVKAFTCCAQYSSRNWQGTMSAQRARLANRRRVVWGRLVLTNGHSVRMAGRWTIGSWCWAGLLRYPARFRRRTRRRFSDIDRWRLCVNVDRRHRRIIRRTYGWNGGRMS